MSSADLFEQVQFFEAGHKASCPVEPALRTLQVSSMCWQMSRYDFLRRSVAYFAASAEDQLAHDTGADDAVNDIPFPLEDMLECGEITRAEIDVIRPLESLIERYCASPGLKPWNDESVLGTDPSWAQIRFMAVQALGRLSGEGGQDDVTNASNKDCSLG